MKVLIVDEMHEVVVEKLTSAGYEVEMDGKLQRNQIIEKLEDVDGLLIRSKTFVDAELIQKANKLKFVARAGAGLDAIDQELLESKGITLIHAAEGNMDAVGEHTVGMVLSLLNHFGRSDRQIRNFEWKREYNRGYELSELTVGIIGCGRMGSAAAKRLLGFGCEVIAYDKYKEKLPVEGVQKVNLDTLFKKADVLTLHVPLTDETNEWVDETFINQFEKNIWIVNAARGKVVKLRDLVMMLESGKVRGAALDVLENEKFDKLSLDEKKNIEKLAENENVLFTPHVAGWSFESYRKISEVLADKILKAFN